MSEIIASLTNTIQQFVPNLENFQNFQKDFIAIYQRYTWKGEASPDFEKLKVKSDLALQRIAGVTIILSGTALMFTAAPLAFSATGVLVIGCLVHVCLFGKDLFTTSQNKEKYFNEHSISIKPEKFAANSAAYIYCANCLSENETISKDNTLKTLTEGTFFKPLWEQWYGNKIEQQKELQALNSAN